jgi:hypothetical protein
MVTFVILLSVVWAILSIILFFKIWGACDDIKRIADKYAPLKNLNDRKSSLESKEEIDKWLKEE